MLRKNVSGQYLYFSLVGVASGLPVVGASGAISGRRCIDGGAMTLLSGFVGEDAGGLYHANLHDFDTNGNNIGFVFSASGVAQITYTITTDGSVSGRVYPPSGVNVVVPPSSLSGLVVNSGLFVTVPPATLSGVVANSGLFVTVPTATLSGVVPASGTMFLPSGSILASTFASGFLNVDLPRDLLKADYSGTTGEAQRSLLNATRKLINRWDLSTTSGHLTVFKEDDSTVAYTQSLTSSSGAAAITSLDTD